MNELHDLAAAYALDALDDAERAEFSAHLATCDRCRRAVADFDVTAGSLATGTATPPPAHLKDSVMAAIADTPQETPATAEVVPIGTRRPATRWIGGVAAAIVLAVVAIGVVIGTHSSNVDIDDVYAAADVRVVTLAGDDADVRVAWSRELDRVVVDGDSLASPGPGNVYELWAIVDDTPVPAGLIDHAGGSLSSLLDVDDLDVAAWGITIEPAGGSPTPTPPILYYAEIE